MDTVGCEKMGSCPSTSEISRGQLSDHIDSHEQRSAYQHAYTLPRNADIDQYQCGKRYHKVQACDDGGGFDVMVEALLTICDYEYNECVKYI